MTVSAYPAPSGPCPECAADRSSGVGPLSDQIIRLASAISRQRLLRRLGFQRAASSPAPVALRPDPGQREPVLYRLCRVCGVACEPDAARPTAFSLAAAEGAVAYLKRELQRETAARLSTAHMQRTLIPSA